MSDFFAGRFVGSGRSLVIHDSFGCGQSAWSRYVLPGIEAEPRCHHQAWCWALDASRLPLLSVGAALA